MRRRALATIGLALILLTTQGCAGFDKFFENLLIASGRLLPPNQPVPCTTDLVRVLPGQCEFLDNACTMERKFIRGDSFTFDNPPEWLRVESTVFQDSVSRSVCVAADAPPVIEAFDFIYISAVTSQSQRGQLIVRTAADLLQARAAATPNTIQVGQSTQLEVFEIVGGAAPYQFAWTQSAPVTVVTTFDDPSRRNPVATITAVPQSEIVTFSVTVTDTVGQSVVAETTIRVGGGGPLQVVVTATPPAIMRGESSQLLATVQGGMPPYSYFWFPGTELTPFPFFEAAETASPTVTTTYEVRVEDSEGTEATASVTVTVLPPPAADQVDIAFTVTDSPDPVVTNRLLTYTTTVTNNGPATATNLAVTLVHPSEMETDSPMPSQGTCMRINSTVIRCTLGTLASGGTVTIGFRGVPFQSGTISFRALLFSVSEVDSNSANNDVTQQTTVLPPS